MLPPPDEQIAALQREVIRAAFDSRRIRQLLGWGAGLGLLALAALVGLTFGTVMEPILAAGCVVLFAAAPTVAIGYFVALPLADRYRAAHQRRLLEKLIPLPPETRASVLLPLRRAGGDSTEIVERLILDLRAQPTEVLPAAAPAGRGDEVAEPGRPPGGSPPRSDRGPALESEPGHAAPSRLHTPDHRPVG
jgi:hypothetical protein